MKNIHLTFAWLSLLSCQLFGMQEYSLNPFYWPISANLSGYDGNIEAIMKKIQKNQSCSRLEAAKQLTIHPSILAGIFTKSTAETILQAANQEKIAKVMHWAKKENLFTSYIDQCNSLDIYELFGYINLIMLSNPKLKQQIHKQQTTVINQHFLKNFSTLSFYQFQLMQTTNDINTYHRAREVHPESLNKELTLRKIFSNNQQLFSQLLKREKIEQEKKRYILYHSQPAELYPIAKICAKIVETLINKKTENYYPLLFLPPWDRPGQRHLTQMMSYQKISEGSDQLLFMNLSPITGSAYSIKNGSGGSSSFWFFLHNSTGFSGIQEERLKYLTNLNSLFKSFEIEDIYQKYQKKLKLLLDSVPQRKHATLLGLSFTPEQLSKSVYLAAPCGRRNSGIKINHTLTTDIQKILDTLCKEPNSIGNCDRNLDSCEYTKQDDDLMCQKNHEHEVEFCALLTQGKNGLLNPWNKGIQVYPFTDVDMTDWNIQLDKLFEEIKNDPESKKIILKAQQTFWDQSQEKLKAKDLEVKSRL